MSGIYASVVLPAYGDYTPDSAAHVASRPRCSALADISDQLDWTAGLVWLRFRLRGEAFDWPARLRALGSTRICSVDSWSCLEGQETPLRYTYLDLGGQDALIGCASPQHSQLAGSHGLNFNGLANQSGALFERAFEQASNSVPTCRCWLA